MSLPEAPYMVGLIKISSSTELINAEVERPNVIIVDPHNDSMWNDDQDIRGTTSVTVDVGINKQIEIMSK